MADESSPLLANRPSASHPQSYTDASQDTANPNLAAHDDEERGHDDHKPQVSMVKIVCTSLRLDGPELSAFVDYLGCTNGDRNLSGCHGRNDSCQLYVTVLDHDIEMNADCSVRGHR